MTRSLPSHAPQGTACHAAVQAYLEPWLEYRNLGRRVVPRYVEEEFRQFLECGSPDGEGVLIVCPRGHQAEHFPGRCKGRGFCAYCLTLRQRELGSRLVGEVIGNVPIFHAVLCFPPSLRCTVGFDARLINGGFHSLIDSVFECQVRKAQQLFGIARGRIHPGSVAVHHPASANLKPNDHFHGLFPDGVFIEAEVGGELRFRRLPALSEEDIAGIAHQAGLAFCRVLESCGFWEPMSTSSDVIEGVLKLPRTSPSPSRFFGEAARYGEGGTQAREGAYPFHLFMSKPIELEARPQLNDLVKYVLAPPFRDDQVKWEEGGGTIEFQLKRERRDGTGHEVLGIFEFLDRLAELVPRPNTNTVRYYGIYGARARLRKQALAIRLEEGEQVERDPVESKVCLTCGEKLRVIFAGRPLRGRSSAIPPDIPQATSSSGRGGRARGQDGEAQGRLFANAG